MDETHAVLLLFFKAGDKCFFGHKSKPLFQWSFKGGSTVVFKGVKREFWFIQTTPASSAGSLQTEDASIVYKNSKSKRFGYN